MTGGLGALLILARDLVALGRPSDEDWTSVKNYFDEEQPTVLEEQYIREREDIITLRACEENTWLDTCIQAFLSKFTTGFIRVSNHTYNFLKSTC